ncbi:MAG: PEP-CTERM sorting domain-containing protein [Armatimonadetes bacterium]|nr:PEP-CTERM sorting domain-containing protein [Armatimonadota bacterium]
MRSGLIVLMILALAAPAAFCDFINTNDVNVYNLFATGATVQDFENVSGLTGLGLDSYTNAYGGTTVPSGSQLSNQISGLHFHSGGASFGDPVGNPGTPTALLELLSPINGDARSASHVIGSLDINADTLNLGQFVEVIFTNSLVDRAGIWLNPSLGPVLFTAFDNTGQSIESGTGNAGNFVGVKSASANIKFISIVSASANGFTADDLTYGAGGGSGGNGNVVPEPGMLLPLMAGSGMLFGMVSRRRFGLRK